MTRAQAIRMLKSQDEVLCTDPASYAFFLSLGLELLSKSLVKVAKVVKAF